MCQILLYTLSDLFGSMCINKRISTKVYQQRYINKGISTKVYQQRYINAFIQGEYINIVDIKFTERY